MVAKRCAPRTDGVRTAVDGAEIHLRRERVVIDAAGTAATCRRFNVGLPALDIVIDGRHVRRRLRDGDSVTAVLAIASQRGIDLQQQP
jgi:hypothetical protein